ncbi:MAG: hypothetical protein KCHDKBKB_01322 [Elusimicrobia bacterium]|nr:hypothetical protein [Elusimicrobiota bacterium]
MQSLKWIIVAALIVMIPVMGQAMSTPGEGELNRAVIEVQRKAIVEKNMQMDAATAALFWPIYEEYVEAMRKPSEKATALLTNYVGNWMTLSEETAKELLDEFFSVKQEQLKVKKSFVGKFLKKLPPKIVARFFQIENKLEAIVAVELAQKVPLVR